MSNENQPQLTFSFPQMQSEARIRQLVLYIAEKCLDDPRFGLVKLNKLLFFADRLSYRRYGTPITGGQYIRMPQGPVPQQMKTILKALEDRNQIAVVKRKVFDYDEHRVVPTSNIEADLELFKARDIALLDELIRFYWGKTAGQMSDESHGIAWKVTENGQPIPYEAMLISDQPITDDDIARAKMLIQEHGWDV